MPLEIRQQLIDDLVNRQAQHESFNRPVSSTSASPPTTLSPSLLALLGGAVDGASTYHFLANGSRLTDDNAMYKPLKGDPLATGLAVAGTGLAGTMLVKKILAHRFPKLADALIANQGANQIGMAGRNIAPNSHTSSAESYNAAITEAIRRSR